MVNSVSFVSRPCFPTPATPTQIEAVECLFKALSTLGMSVAATKLLHEFPSYVLEAWAYTKTDKVVKSSCVNAPFSNKHSGTRRKAEAWKSGMRHARKSVTLEVKERSMREALSRHVTVYTIRHDALNIEMCHYREQQKRAAAKVKEYERKLRRYNNRLDRLMQTGQYEKAMIHTQSGGPKAPNICVPTVHGPVMTHAAYRAVRDEIQRTARKQRTLREYRSIPKAERKREVLQNRDLRNPLHNEDITCQGGDVVGRVAIGLTCAVALPTIRKLHTLITSSSKSIDKANSLLDSLKSFADTIKATVAGAFWLIPLCIVCLVLVKDAPLLVQIAVATALGTIVGKDVWKLVKPYFTTDTKEIKSQSGIYDNLGKLTATLACFSVFKGKMRGDRISELLKRIALLPRLKEGTEELAKWIVSAVECTINWFSSFFGEQRVSLIKKAHLLFEQWQRDVDKDCKFLATGQDASPEFVKTCVDHLIIGYGLKEQYRGHPMYRSVQETLIRLENTIRPYKGVLHSSNNFRYEPSLVLINGKPGIGKTLLMQHFCLAAMLLSGTLPRGISASDASAHIWQKGTSDYWNGYTNQTCIIMDDAFQQRVDSTDKENEYINIIRMIGTWAYPLNFADLESKGNIYFNSRLVVGTTNLSSITSEAAIALNEPEAVIRRISHPLALQLKPEYALDGRLDFKKYEAELLACAQNKGVDRYPWYIWNVQRLNYGTGQLVGNPYPLREALLELVGDLKLRATSHVVARDQLTDFVDGVNADFISEIEPAIESQSGLFRRIKRGFFNHAKDFDKKCDDNIAEAGFIIMQSREEYRAYENDSRIVQAFLKGCGISFLLGAGAAIAFRALRVALSAAINIFKCVVTAPFKLMKRREPKEVVSHSNAPQVKPRWYKHKSVTAQSGTVAISRNAYGNSYKLVLGSGDSARAFGQIIFVNDCLAIEPHHFARDMSLCVKSGSVLETDTVTFTHAEQQNFSFSMNVAKYLGFKRCTHVERDLSFVRFEDVRAHRNIETNFITHADVPHVVGRNVRLDVFNSNTSRGKYGEHMVHAVAKSTIGLDLSFGTAFGMVKLDRYVKYMATTTSGDCGAPLSFMDASSFSGRGIIGFHVAGAEHINVGYSTIVTQEMIANARKELGTVNDLFETDLSERVEVQCGSTLPFPQPGSFLGICKVKDGVRLNPHSSLTPIPGVFGSFGDSDERPAPMSKVFRDGQWVYPMEKALSGYATGVLQYQQPWLNHAIYVAFKPMFDRTRMESRKLYTFDQAVKGAPQDKLRSIPRGTSAGYPYVLEVRNGKKEFFGFDDEVTVDGELASKLRARVEHVLQSAARGERLSHVFMDCLKDELRSAKKVEAVETRLLAASPLDYLIAFRMMFGSFITACMRNHTGIGMAPGINPYTDWGALRDTLRQKSTKVFDGDFKAFDKSEMPCILGRFVDHINRWYDERPDDAGGGERNNRIRSILWLELVHSRHIGGMGYDQTFIYQWNKSLPSGHPCTTIANSFYALVCIIVAYISATGDLTGFWDNVSCVTYGDDNITSAVDGISTIFNQATVATHLKQQLDMTYTPGNKTDIWVERMDLEESTFLKRGFACEDGHWLAPLCIESIISMAYWNKGTKHLERDLKAKFESMLMELSLHPQEIWDFYAPKVFALMAQKEISPATNLDRASYRLITRGTEDFWF